MKIFELENISLFKRSLDVYSAQHEALSKNIAHASDPEFKREKSDFSEALKGIDDRRLKTSNSRHISGSEEPERSDLKNGDAAIDVTREMSELAENQIRFEFVSRVLNRTYSKLNTSITGRTT